MAEPLIFHIDVNSAFLSWTSVDRLSRGESDLRDIPSIIGGDQDKRHGIVLAKSGPAKKFGILTGEPITSALKKCPDLVIDRPCFELYERQSRAFREVLARFAPEVEPFSIDEAFADMTGTERLYGGALAAAEKIRSAIREELGFTVNIGISTNRLLAKMASDFEKPDRIHTLYPEEVPEKMWPLPVGDLFMVGGSTEKKLKELGICTIGQLACADVSLLRAHLKKQGEIIHQYANGRDESGVFSRFQEEAKGYGNSTTLPFDVEDAPTAKNFLLSLCETVATRLRADQKKATCITVHLTYHTFENKSHQRGLSVSTDVTNEIYSVVCELFDELWDGRTPIRLLGVSCSRLTEESYRQYSLFDLDKYEKYEKLDAAIDRIRGKYGEDAIKRASFLHNPGYELVGGLSKDRRVGTATAPDAADRSREVPSKKRTPPRPH